MSSKFAVITNLHIYGEISNPSTADGSLTYDLTMADLNYLLIPDIKIGTINNFISITYLHRSYRTTSVYFNRINSDVDLYIKRRILIEPLSVVKLPTENILYCSMVLNVVDNLTPIDVGIPSGRNYLEWDYHLNEIKKIIDNNYPKLRQKINQIDVEYQR